MIDARPLHLRRLQLHRGTGIEFVPSLLPGMHSLFRFIQRHAGTLLQFLRLAQGAFVLGKRLGQLVDQTAVGS